MNHDQTMLRFENISKSFQEGQVQRHVLKNVTADFPTGKFSAIIGPSGSGKSTLLNLACGIEDPDHGRVMISNTDITAMRDHQRTLFRRDHVGFIFQFFNLIPTLTVLENITLPQELAGKRSHDVAPGAMRLLDAVDLADRKDTYPDKLSGGEQQRVAIARALAHDPLLVLADEPTGNLDEKTGTRVMDLLLNLTRRAGKTLIMVTHSPMVIPLADKVLQMTAGQLITQSPTLNTEIPSSTHSYVATTIES